MTALRLGSKLTLPLDAVTRTTAIVGQRGTGKTSTAVVLVEEAARAGAQAAVIDPTGAWYGLRSSADGNHGGLEVVVFGGHHGDVPLEPEAGAFLARLVIDQGISVALDLEKMTKGKQVQFVAEFAEELYHRNRTALTLVIDEAHRFAPQQLRDPGGYGARCLGAVTDVVTLGRRKGLGAILISQRPAKINKDVFEQAEIMVSHRLMGPNDRKAIAGWLDETGAGEDRPPGTQPDAVRNLDRGHAIVYAPTYDIYGAYAIRPKRTFDSSATPEIGQRVIEPKGRADIDLAAIEQAMGDTIARAKADDPAALRKTIADLRRQIAELEQRPAEPVEVPVPYIPEGVIAALDNLERVVGAVDTAAGEIQTLVADLQNRNESGDHPDQATLASHVHATRPPAPPRPARSAIPLSDPRPAPRTNGTGPSLKAGARRMLAALASLHPMPLTRAQVGTLAKVKRTGGTYGTYLSALKYAGYVSEDGDHLTITPDGFDALGTAPPAPATAEELRSMWRDRLKAGARRMLDELLAAHPQWLHRSELAERAGIAQSGGTFGTYLGMLRTAGLIDEDGGNVRAADVLFLGARSRA